MENQYKQISGRAAPEEDTAAVAATGTYTVVTAASLAGKTVTVAGHVLTEGVEWTKTDGDNNATATSLASAINGLSEVNASATNAVVTVTAASAGAAGNSITTTTNGGADLTVEQAQLSGGADTVVNSLQIVLASDTGCIVRLISAHIFITVAAIGGDGILQLKDGSTVLWECDADAIAQHDIDFHDGLGYPISEGTDLTVLVSGAGTTQASAIVLATGFLTGK